MGHLRNNVLYSFFQPIFTESLIGHFLTVLMQVLMHKSHDLLKEEIILAAFHMANVDFGTVHVLYRTIFAHGPKGVPRGVGGEQWTCNPRVSSLIPASAT